MNKKRIVYTLSGVIVMAMSSTDIFLSSLPQMAIDFKVEPDIVNLMLTVNALGMALGADLSVIGTEENCYLSTLCNNCADGIVAADFSISML